MAPGGSSQFQDLEKERDMPNVGTEDSARALCKGCQDFVDAACYSYWKHFGTLPGWKIHDSYAELSACAESVCDLCKFLRRELWFDSTYGEYVHRDAMRASDCTICIIPYQSVNEGELCWYMKTGESYGKFRFIEKSSKEESSTGKVRGAHPSLEELLGVTRGWLATCQTEHKSCSIPNPDTLDYLPTRLLDVRLSEQGLVRLVDSDCLGRETNRSYVTLSYCWGGSNHAARTTLENLTQRMNTISTSILPRTIQDAILVTRNLGIKYLWVDALCIVQMDAGENEDWQRQLPQMGRIYHHSLFTIAASSGEDSDSGLFRRIEAACWSVHNYPISIAGVEFALQASPPDWSLSVESSPLSRRGWVLQERMLTSRSLLWTEEGLFWECKELRTSEYKNELDIVNSGHGNPQLDTIVQRINEDKFHAWAAWSDLVERFSRKDLTVVTDRLPAVMGVGQEIARLTGNEYSLGVFTHNLVHELAWVTGFPWQRPFNAGSVKQQETALPGLPSWSWASTTQAVHFRVSRNRKELVSKALLDGKQIRFRGRLGKVELQPLKDHCELDWSTTFYPSQHTFQPITHHTRRDHLGRTGNFAVFDTLTDSANCDGTILCVAWLEFDGWNHYQHGLTGALMLTAVDGIPNTYRRIGWLESEDADFFEDEFRDVVLV